MADRAGADPYVRRRRASATRRATSAHPRRAAGRPFAREWQGRRPGYADVSDCPVQPEGPARAARRRPAPRHAAQASRVPLRYWLRRLKCWKLHRRESGQPRRSPHRAAAGRRRARCPRLARQGRTRIRARSIPTDRPGGRRRSAAGRPRSCRWAAPAPKAPRGPAHDADTATCPPPCCRGSRSMSLVRRACAHRAGHRRRPRWLSEIPSCICMHISALVQSFDKEWNSCRTRRAETAMSDQFSAWQLILTGDPTLLAIVRLSLAVSLSAVALAALVGMPFGALLALTGFPGRSALVVLLNALMGLPPVVVGLAVYLLLSRSGPLGELGILFTPSAMVIAQTILIAPIIAALTRQTVEDLWTEYRDELTAMDVSPIGRMMTLLWDARYSLLTALLAGFGRAAAEVGAVMIVGGNIDGFTRTMTTAVALETSKGDLPLAMGLGLVLVAIVLAINAAAWGTRVWSERQAG